MAKKKSSTQKKLELLRKTQEVTEIVERGNIEEQALSDTASSQGVSDEQHVVNILNTEEEQMQSRPKGKGAKPKPQRKRRK
ncbi:MAG: hypothetical protein KGH59_02670 [Candidatus Micrarchaeota archaeon]|nr:hypothetical protein [Candidatus Micrarchaeota archaeon]MDE1804660.1 hypothetical protein [Candidatus Micrarchaeota archaeon]MDE1846866.1 hypothetical protein [Candidatus Micrarchaeota archaeon]